VATIAGGMGRAAPGRPATEGGEPLPWMEDGGGGGQRIPPGPTVTSVGIGGRISSDNRGARRWVGGRGRALGTGPIPAVPFGTPRRRARWAGRLQREGRRRQC